MKREHIFLIDRSRSVYKNSEKILSFYEDALNQSGLISLALFGDELDVICMRQPAELVKDALVRNYYNDGNTAIFDSVCKFLEQWDRYMDMTGAAETDADLYVVTDGIDTGSVGTDFEDFQKMIRDREAAGWHVVLMDTSLKTIGLDSLNIRGAKCRTITKKHFRQERC